MTQWKEEAAKAGLLQERLDAAKEKQRTSSKELAR
jgi:hypothetical protein